MLVGNSALCRKQIQCKWNKNIESWQMSQDSKGEAIILPERTIKWSRRCPRGKQLRVGSRSLREGVLLEEAAYRTASEPQVDEEDTGVVHAQGVGPQQRCGGRLWGREDQCRYLDPSGASRSRVGPTIGRQSLSLVRRPFVLEGCSGAGGGIERNRPSKYVE